MVPSASLEPLPSSEPEFVGKTIEIEFPAFATGGWLEEAFTVIWTVSLAVAPELSVTVNSNI